MSGFEKDRKRLDAEFDEVVNDVYPDELRSYVARELSTTRKTPALLCLLSARLTDGKPDEREAAGVQLVHAGLDATRRVLDGNGWEDAGVEPVEEDMVLLAADVLVTVGFDRLLDEYEAATRLVNTFGSAKARALEADAPEERFEHVSGYFAEAYTTAVGVGHEDASDGVVALAEAVGVADYADVSGYGSVNDGYARRAKRLLGELEGRGCDEYVAGVRDESAVDGVHETADADAGVEAQD